MGKAVFLWNHSISVSMPKQGIRVFLQPFSIACLLVALCGPTLFADAPKKADDAEADEAAWNASFHQRLYELDPLPPASHAQTSVASEQRRLEQLDQTEEDDFTALPLIGARISSLPVFTDAPGDEATTRAEYALIRARAKTADRLVKRGNFDEAVALMLNTETLLKNASLRATALNRVAAYYFRSQDYKKAADYMRQAWATSPGDVANACNLSAVLLTIGEVDEALNLLLQVYGQVFDHPQLAFPVHFNLACAYSLKGENSKALQNLLIAARADPAAVFTAIGDPNLDPIREEAGFVRIYKTLVGMMQPSAEAAKP